eukprot:jgi/Mesvir1/21425/Mv20895-RA.1
MKEGDQIWDRLRPSKAQLGFQLVGNLLLPILHKQALSSVASFLAASMGWHLLVLLSVPFLVTKPLPPSLLLASSWLAKLTKEDVRSRLRDLDETFPFQTVNVPNTTPGKDKRERSNAIVLTGGTGFVGQALLFELLRCADQTGIGKVILVIRKSRQGDAKQRSDSVRARLEEVRSPLIMPRGSDATGPTIDDISGKSWVSRRWDQLIDVVEGDVKLPACGVNPSDLVHYNITHVVHCAAIVRFTDPLPVAAENNITGTLNAFELARTLGARMVHVSTAYVTGWTARMFHESSNRPSWFGLPRADHPKSAFQQANSAFLDASMAHLLSSSPPDTGGFDPDQLYQSMREGGPLACRAMSVLGHPNTYIFSKVIAEALLIRRASQALRDGTWSIPGVSGRGAVGRTTPAPSHPLSSAPASNELASATPPVDPLPQAALHIVRPSIVTSAWVSPAPGWLGNRPTTVSGVLATMDHTWLVMRCHVTRAHLPVVPVDLVARAVLHQVAGKRPKHAAGHASAWTQWPSLPLLQPATLPLSSTLPSASLGPSAHAQALAQGEVGRPLCVGRIADARVISSDLPRLLGFLPEEARDALGSGWDISLAALCFGREGHEDDDDKNGGLVEDGTWGGPAASIATGGKGVGSGQLLQGGAEQPPMSGKMGQGEKVGASPSAGIKGGSDAARQNGLSDHGKTSLEPSEMPASQNGYAPGGKSSQGAQVCIVCTQPPGRCRHGRWGLSAERMPSFQEFTTLVTDEAWRHRRPAAKIIYLGFMHSLCKVRPRRHLTELVAMSLSAAHNTLTLRWPLRALAAVIGLLAVVLGGDKTRRGRRLCAVQRNLVLAAGIPGMMAPFAQWPFRVVDGLARPEVFNCTRYMQELIDSSLQRRF